MTLGLSLSFRPEVEGHPFVISTKAGGRAEKSGREWTTRPIRSQMSRLRCASLDMTDGATFT
jgi:hypothetical protein